MHKTTLEQWAILSAVVESGSFARAAEMTHRSQSSVSYNLALLQQRLGVALLQTEGRRAVLTLAGSILLDQVKPLLDAFTHVEARATTLRDGARPRIDLVVDSIFPRTDLFDILLRFQQLHPATQVHLTEILEHDYASSEVNAQADMMILTRRQDIFGRGQWLMNIDFIAVAHRDYGLHHLPAPLTDSMLNGWPLISIGSGKAEAPAQWIFSTVDAAIEAVTAQVGYGWLPEARITPQLQSGVLKILPLNHGQRRATPLHILVKKEQEPLDVQVTELLKLFQSITR